MLFLLVLAVTAPFALGASGETHYVSPACNSQSSSCVTLDMIATTLAKRFWIQGNFTLVFLPGIHRLSQSISVSSQSSYTRDLSLTLRGMGKAVIQCPGNGTSISFTGLSRLGINGLTFSDCGGIDPFIQRKLNGLQLNFSGLRVSLTTMVTISNSSFDISWIAIYNCNRTVVQHSTFKNHIHVMISNGIYYFKGRLFVANSVFNGRLLVKYRFQGLKIENLHSVLIKNSTFQLTSWSKLYTQGGVPLLIQNSTAFISRVAFQNNVASDCGGVLAKNSEVIMISVLFRNNTASNGSVCAVQSRVDIINASITRNKAVGLRGILGLRASQSRIWLRNVLFSSNTGYSSVPLLVQNCTVYITRVAFWNNVASDCGGVLAKKSTIDMTSVLFHNNTALDGSICAVQSMVDITNASITRNRAVGLNGTGGLKATQSNIWLKNVLFSSNTGYDGGAVQMNDSILFTNDAIFKKNTATHFGGAVYSVSSTATFQHSFFSNNRDYLGKTFFSVNSQLLRKSGRECSESHDSGSEFQCRMSKAQSVLSGTCNSFTREKLNAGYEPCVYKDSKSMPTIGIGFNLHRSGARQDISAVGANYDQLLSGSQCLTDRQIQQLFNRDMATAVSCAQRFVGSNWYRLGETRQSAVADMAFNLGCTKLHGFRRFQAALQSSPPNYRAAVREMRDSSWCRQVGGRCGRNVACMSSSLA